MKDETLLRQRLTEALVRKQQIDALIQTLILESARLGAIYSELYAIINDLEPEPLERFNVKAPSGPGRSADGAPAGLAGRLPVEDGRADGQRAD